VIGVDHVSVEALPGTTVIPEEVQTVFPAEVLAKMNTSLAAKFRFIPLNVARPVSLVTATLLGIRPPYAVPVQLVKKADSVTWIPAIGLP
jgi:hypothetical protein